MEYMQIYVYIYPALCRSCLQVGELTSEHSRTRYIPTKINMKQSLLPLALLAAKVYGWLPQDQELEAFNQTANYAAVGKRFEPSLPSGINKIRGVNFGGM